MNQLGTSIGVILLILAGYILVQPEEAGKKAALVVSAFNTEMAKHARRSPI